MKGYVLVEIRPYPVGTDADRGARVWAIQQATRDLIAEIVHDARRRGAGEELATAGVIRVEWGATGLEVWLPERLAVAMGYRVRCEEVVR